MKRITNKKQTKARQYHLSQKTNITLIPLQRPSPPPTLRTITAVSAPVTITVPPAAVIAIPAPRPAIRPLSELISIGRTYHPLCRHAFIEKRTTGYYHYERRIQYRTCALAAAYAAAFGPAAIEQPEFSYSMACWRLAQIVGYDPDTLFIYGPTGRYQPLAAEIIQLVDSNLWTRQGVAEWLAAEGL